MTQLLKLKRLWAEEEAQNVSEYTLLLFLISLTAVTAMGGLASRIGNAYSSASTRVEGVSRSGSFSAGTQVLGVQPQTNRPSLPKDDKSLSPDNAGVSQLSNP